MIKEMLINKSVMDIIFKSCYPTGMECKNCDGKFVSFSEIEDKDGVVTEVHLNCSKCMKTFGEFIIIDDTKDIAKDASTAKASSCSCGGKCGE